MKAKFSIKMSFKDAQDLTMNMVLNASKIYDGAEIGDEDDALIKEYGGGRTDSFDLSRQSEVFSADNSD